MHKIFFYILYPFSIIYGLLMFIRNKFYDWNILKSTKFNFPIISIGNLSLGGTGKTPHTEYLIRLLQKDFNICTLSRGYKRETTGFYLAQKDSTVSQIGDEPLQYKNKFDLINVAVCEKRVSGVVKIKIQLPKTNLVILDDAFQHRAISPGLNILITEFNNLYSNDTVIPSGRLREWKKGSERADIIIVSKTKSDLTELEKQNTLSKLNPSSQQKVFFSFINYGELIPFTQSAKTLPEKEDTALLITGIAKPSPLLNRLKEKYTNIEHLQFPDHHNYNTEDIDKIISKFSELKGNNKFIISTEKDIMRLSLPEILKKIQNIPIFYIPIEIQFHGTNKTEFDNQIKEYVTKNKRD